MLRPILLSMFATTAPVVVASVLAWRAFVARGHFVLIVLIAIAALTGLFFALHATRQAQAATRMVKRLRRLRTRTARAAGGRMVPAAAAAAADPLGEATRLVDLLDGVAAETKLLAINATIEAARAGDAGSTFATMADDVRALAHRGSQLARGASELLRPMQRS